MRRFGLTGLVLLLAAAACNVQRRVADRLGASLAEGDGLFAAEDDPDLVREASPAALKALEALLARSPSNPRLLLAASSGFLQYAHAFLQEEADYEASPERAARLRERAKRLYLRARNYGMRGLEAALPGFSAQFREGPEAALARAGAAQAPLLYATGASWAAAFALDLGDADLALDQTRIEALMRRALALDPGWDGGAVHEFFVAWEGAHAQVGGSYAAARDHFREALRRSGGRRASLFVTLAEAVSLPAQDPGEFERVLHSALDLDPDADPPHRLATLLAQRRARWLLGRKAELFNEPEGSAP